MYIANQFSFISTFTSTTTTLSSSSFTSTSRRRPRLTTRNPSPSTHRRVTPTAAVWPVTRFLSNFLFFTPLGKALRGAPRSSSSMQTTQSGMITDTVLVTGASGGTGRRVLTRLLTSEQTKHCNVVALTRCRDSLLSALSEQGLDETKVNQYEQSGKLRVIINDMFNVPSDALFGITKAISTTGTKTGPKDDDIRRSKYYQGIILYPAAVLEDTPENVELIGVKRMTNLLQKEYQDMNSIQALGNKIFDFHKVNENWGSLDDVVMGGISKSATYTERGALIFSGDVSTENNGGFASTRTTDFDQALNLKQYDGLCLRVRNGTGINGKRRYKIIVRCEKKWDGIAYCYSFDVPNNSDVDGDNDGWTFIKAPFSEFRPVIRGKIVTNDTVGLKQDNIVAFQFMHSKFEYDGDLNPSFAAGKFRLYITDIRPYIASTSPSSKQNQGPNYIHLSSAAVTRPQRLDEVRGTEADVPILQLNDKIGRLLDWKLAGEDAVRQTKGLDYTIVRSCALTLEQPKGIDHLKFEQGDLLNGRVSRDDMADLLVSLLSCKQAVGKTFEVATIEKEDDDKEDIGMIDGKIAPLKRDVDTPRTFGPFPYVPVMKEEKDQAVTRAANN